MRTNNVIVLAAVALVGCSGNPSNEAAYNDVATGVRLLGVDLIQEVSPSDRAARLAECSAVLTSHVSQSPPPERASRLRELADRLQRIAITVGEANGRTAAQINALRDEAIAAQRQMATNNGAVYASAMAHAVDRCDLAIAMTDDELAGRGLGLPGNDLAPPSMN